MVNTEALKEEIRKKGYTMDTLAREIGKTRTCLFNKIHNKSEFRITEINKISMALRLRRGDVDRIFFAKDVE